MFISFHLETWTARLFPRPHICHISPSAKLPTMIDYVRFGISNKYWGTEKNHWLIRKHDNKSETICWLMQEL
ncbi:hypothetical protein ACH3XW_46805 [Acanthocheilonema viteae]